MHQFWLSSIFPIFLLHMMHRILYYQLPEKKKNHYNKKSLLSVQIVSSLNYRWKAEKFVKSMITTLVYSYVTTKVKIWSHQDEFEWDISCFLRHDDFAMLQSLHNYIEKLAWKILCSWGFFFFFVLKKRIEVHFS